MEEGWKEGACAVESWSLLLSLPNSGACGCGAQGRPGATGVEPGSIPGEPIFWLGIQTIHTHPTDPDPPARQSSRHWRGSSNHDRLSLLL